MKDYTYRFIDETTKTVEVSDEFYTMLEEMDKQEKRNNKRETRRHISLDYLTSKGIDVEQANSNILLTLLKQEDEQDFEKLLNDLLTQKQFRAIKMSVIEGMTEQEIALIEDVSQQAISDRIKTAKKVLQCFFETL